MIVQIFLIHNQSLLNATDNRSCRNYLFLAWQYSVNLNKDISTENCQWNQELFSKAVG